MNNDITQKFEIKPSVGETAGQSTALPQPNEKSRLIYEAAIALLEEGYAPSDIKMSEIAKRAGTGKSTLYEYFESKEQLIHEAKVYAVSRMTDKLALCMEGNDDFDGKIRRFVLQLTKDASDNFILFQSVAKYDMPEMLSSESLCTGDRRDIAKKWINIADSICQSALDEGIISAKPCDYKKHIAVITLITTSLIYCGNRKQYSDIAQEQMISIVTENLKAMLK